MHIQPIYKERVWGGRSLETLYLRTLPDDSPYGESWDIVDRAEDVSVITTGPYRGKTLHELWVNHREEVFGVNLPESERFPLLIKILDAQTDLSIQVHPPRAIAEKLGGEPKTEMWYIAEASPGAKLYVGVKAGVTAESFEAAIKNGTVEECVHSIEPQAGQSIHIESGRLHAIGAGLVIYEIQQNSDTTYRVYDWNRIGLDGKPRDLHINASMQCIDFTDIEPEMDTPNGNILADCPYYKVARYDSSTELIMQKPDRFAIISIISGSVKDEEGNLMSAGDMLLLPRDSDALEVIEPVCYLETTL